VRADERGHAVVEPLLAQANKSRPRTGPALDQAGQVHERELVSDLDDVGPPAADDRPHVPERRQEIPMRQEHPISAIQKRTARRGDLAEGSPKRHDGTMRLEWRSYDSRARIL
jgi:hypothetical protein